MNRIQDMPTAENNEYIVLSIFSIYRHKFRRYQRYWHDTVNIDTHPCWWYRQYRIDIINIDIDTRQFWWYRRYRNDFVDIDTTQLLISYSIDTSFADIVTISLVSIDEVHYDIFIYRICKRKTVMDTKSKLLSIYVYKEHESNYTLNEKCE